MEPTQTAQRSASRFSTFAGAVLATAGVAIGLGNIWRFPYMMGRDGGSAFLLIYLLILAFFGAPMLMCELALGRHTRRGPWGALQRTGMPYASFFAGVLILTVVMAASYYAVVIGWVLQEFVAFARLGISHTPMEEYSTTIGSGEVQFAYLAGVVAVGCGVLALGVRRGIEKGSAILLPIFFLLFILILGRVLTLPGAVGKLADFLTPNWSDFSSRTALSAMGQAVFSLGLGGTFMVQYGSYMRKEQSIPKTAIFTVGADLLAALMAGAIIVPAVLVNGMDLSAGPSLLFSVMPQVFSELPAGALAGAGFFFAVFVVALLSLIAAYEVIAAAMGRAFGLSRRSALLILFVSQCALAVPAYLFARYIEISDLVWGTTMQPIGAAIAVIALTWFVGRTNTLTELRRNAACPVPDWLYWWVRFAVPVAIVFVLVVGWWDWLRPA